MDGFSEKDVYKALDLFDKYNNELQKWIYDHSEKICTRDMSVSYFDCTNYYFDIGRSDMDTFDNDGNPIDDKGNPTEVKYRKRDPEKNHMPDPIVEMGLLMDKNGIPLAFDLFPGNESEKFKDEDGNEITFTHKSRIHPKTIHVNLSVPGQKKKKKKDVSIDRKQMAYYSEKYARKQKRDRDIMIERAKDLIAHPKKYDKITAAGSGSYVQNIAFDKTTGEIVEGRELSLNLEKIAEEEKYDGYYSIVTSELNMSDHEIRDTYRGLARIEETFKISKTEFESRPVFVWTNEHIEGHFATCFTALVLIRLLQVKLGKKYPIGQTIESLRKCRCTKIDTILYQFIYYDEILKECGRIFNLELNQKYRTQEQMRRLLKY